MLELRAVSRSTWRAGKGRGVGAESEVTAGYCIDEISVEWGSPLMEYCLPHRNLVRVDTYFYESDATISVI